MHVEVVAITCQAEALMEQEHHGLASKIWQDPPGKVGKHD